MSVKADTLADEREQRRIAARRLVNRRRNAGAIELAHRDGRHGNGDAWRDICHLCAGRRSVCPLLIGRR